MASNSGPGKSKRSNETESPERMDSDSSDESESAEQNAATAGKRMRTTETETNRPERRDSATAIIEEIFASTDEDEDADTNDPAENEPLIAARYRGDDTDRKPKSNGKSSKYSAEDIKKYDPTPSADFPKHRWCTTSAVLSRQYGYGSKFSPDVFRYDCYGSLHMVQRLELMDKMKEHEGCVNTLHFNSAGSRLVSSSDDLSVILWDWAVGEPVLVYGSGHILNVFQAKFLPFSNDSQIVTCARDGQVRLGEIHSDGTCLGTRKLAQHKDAAHKLAILPDSRSTFMTCGEDGAVFFLDVRKEGSVKILNCTHALKKVPLYSIHSNPMKSHEFIVAGRNRFVKMYDSRYMNDERDIVKQMCPLHLAKDSSNKVNISCAVYNYNGTEVLASYNEEDIYIFDAKNNTEDNTLFKYRGHRNNQTVKGVNYFGSKSEYIVSGSDCGYIFFWDKESQHVVKYMHGDEGGAVNCLEPHPHMPILASSGLDDDIKIWVPSCEYPPDMSELQNHLVDNMKYKESESVYPGEFVNSTILFLMQHLSRNRRRDPDAASTSSDSSDFSDNLGAAADASPPGCSQS